MDIDLGKQRRTLLGIAAALAIYEVGGGTLAKLTMLGGGLEITNPERLLFFAYLVLIYLVWRYWLLMKEEQLKLKTEINEVTLSVAPLSKILCVLEENFKENSGINFVEGFQKVNIGNTGAAFMPVPIRRRIEISPFKRAIAYEADNPRGDLKFGNAKFDLPFMTYAACWMWTTLKLAVIDKQISNIYVPYVLAAIAIVIRLARHGAV